MSTPHRPHFHWPISPQRLLVAPHTTPKTSSTKNKLWAIVSYIFFPIAMPFIPKQNEFVWFHIRQSFGIFIASLFVYIVGEIGLYILSLVLNVALVGIWCVGMSNVLYGKQKELPVIGKLSEKYKVF